MPLKILAVDDEPISLMLLGKLLERMGHTVVVAHNGREAVEQYQAEAPDLVLMDIMMPEMDGYEATWRIREVDRNKWVPIIFVAALSEDEDYLKGFKSGADDYITKPINKIILEARIAAVTRIADMHRQLAADARQLSAYREETEREMALAKHLISKITGHGLAGSCSDLVSLYSYPAAHFSGDVFLSTVTPAGDIYLMLADATGHGLSAALNVIPVVEAFYGMGAKGFSIGSIARELNRKVKHLMPADRFVAATLVSINLQERVLTLWNGGNPPVLLTDEHGNLCQRWKSAHHALGILGDDAFNACTEAFLWDQPSRLYLFSDGLIEARDGARKEMGLARIEGLLASSLPDAAFSAIVAAVSEHRGDAPVHDDITLACVACPIVADGESATGFLFPPALLQEAVSGHWRMELRLTAAELSKIDVVPMFLGWVGQLGLEPSHRGKVFLVFTELFNNAIDHGILRLDSALKEQTDGINRYFEERRRRLAGLVHGMVEIEVERVFLREREMLKIRMRDSGEGFDHAALAAAPAMASPRLSGRGLALVRSLCQEVTFTLHGSEVRALYPLT